MPSGYVIAQLKITNPENYKEYIEKILEDSFLKCLQYFFYKVNNSNDA